MSKRKLQRAQQLIKQKRYDQAREILEQLDDPTAYDWLVRLDEIAPKPLKPKAKPQRQRGCTGFIVVGLLGCIAPIVLITLIRTPSTQERIVTQTVAAALTSAVMTQSVSDTLVASTNATVLTQMASGTDTPVPTEAPTLAPAESFYVTSNANARSCASTDCDSVTVLNNGTRVEVVGLARGQIVSGSDVWRMVLAGGQVTYVHSSFLTQTTPQPTRTY